MDYLGIASLITALLAGAGVIYQTYSKRRGDSAGAYDVLSQTVERQDARMEKLRDDISETRAMLFASQADVAALRQEIAKLKNDLFDSETRRQMIADDFEILLHVVWRLYQQMREATGAEPELSDRERKIIFRGKNGAT